MYFFIMQYRKSKSQQKIDGVYYIKKYESLVIK